MRADAHIRLSIMACGADMQVQMHGHRQMNAHIQQISKMAFGISPRSSAGCELWADATTNEEKQEQLLCMMMCQATSEVARKHAY